MADIGIEVDFTDLKTASASVKQFGNDWASAVNKIITEDRRMAAASNATADIQERALARVNAKLAEKVAKQQEAANKAAAAAAKEASDLDKLRAAYDKGYTAVYKYNQMKADLERLMRSGKGDINAYRMELERLTQEFVEFQNGAARAGNTFAQLDNAFITGNKSANRFQAGIQNAGYQVADFAVQVQNGTSWIVAFGQQGSQLISMVPGWGALAGAAIAIGSALATMYFGTKSASEGAKDLKADLEGLRDLEDIFEGAGATLENTLGGAIDRVRERYGDFIADIVESQASAEAEKMAAAFTSISSAQGPSWLKEWVGYLSDAAVGTMTGAPAGFAAENDQQAILAGRVQPILQQFQEGRSPDEMVEIYREVLSLLEAQGLAASDVYTQVQAAAREAGIEAEAIEQQRERSEALADVLAGNVSLHSELSGYEEDGLQSIIDANAERAKANDYYTNQFVALSEQNQLLQAQQQYGADSVQYLDAQHQIAQSQLVVEAERAGLGEQQIDILLRQLQAGQEIERQQFLAANAAENYAIALSNALGVIESITGADIEGPVWNAVSAADAFYSRMVDVLGIIQGITAAIGSIEMNTIALNAENAALSAGANAAAANRAGQVALNQERINQSGIADIPLIGGFLAGAMQNNFEAATAEQLAAQNQNDTLMDALREREREARGGGKKGRKGSGKSPEEIAEEIAEAFEKINEETDFIEGLAGMNEEERRHAEMMRDITGEFGEHAEHISETQIDAMAKERIAAEDLLQATLDLEEATERLATTLVDDFTGAVLSVVEGTASIKDAFNSMIRDMIIDMYKQKVMEPYAEYATNFLTTALSGGFANGGAFNAGGQVSYFAKGDVFNSPTAFQFGGGKTGIMGEAGPEAVMPLKRGPDGKLGVASSGGGNVIQNIHWHINANGDSTIRNIVREESPKVAEMAASSVMNKQLRAGPGRRSK